MDIASALELQQGLQDSLIQTHGRWMSDTYKIYVKFPRAQLAWVSHTLDLIPIFLTRVFADSVTQRHVALVDLGEILETASIACLNFVSLNASFHHFYLIAWIIITW